MKDFDELVDVVSTLRKKCPWDKKQTHKTLRPYMLEETNEAIEAININDHKKLCEELGDQLLHIVMHAEMASEKEFFSIKDVIAVIREKMIRRHPHVFGRLKTKKISEIYKRWKKIKQIEKYADKKGIKLSKLNDKTMEKLWKEIKKNEV